MALSHEDTGHEITNVGPLLDNNGVLIEPGWSRKLVLAYNRDKVNAYFFRLKEWDYYCIPVGNGYWLALTVADNGYMAMVSASVLKLQPETEAFQVTDTAMKITPCGGSLRMPEHPVHFGKPIVARIQGAILVFSMEEEEEAVRKLIVSWPSWGTSSNKFGGNHGLEASVVMRQRMDEDSIVVATPFPGAPTQFYYNQKALGLEIIHSSVRVGSTTLVDSANDIPRLPYAVLDWGRGVWPYGCRWVWAAASGDATLAESGKKVKFGLNLGFGFGDLKTHSENCVICDGKLHKFGIVDIAFNTANYMEDWQARSKDGRVKLNMKTILDRAAYAGMLGVLSSDQHQVFGAWSGSVALEDGSTIIVQSVIGWAENVVNYW